MGGFKISLKQLIKMTSAWLDIFLGCMMLKHWLKEAQTVFSTRCNIYISCLCYDISVRLSVVCLWRKCIGAL